MDPETKILFDLAVAARANAYAPISKFRVGASVLTESGKYFSGCNVESATLTSSTHAETNAIDSAITAGENRIMKILIVLDTNEAAFPCALCRQKIMEFSDNAQVITANSSGTLSMMTIEDLYPKPFLLKDVLGT